jgi:hypothetical protein
MFLVFSDEAGVCSVNELRGGQYRADIVREVYRVRLGPLSRDFECNVTVIGHVKPCNLVDRCKGIGKIYHIHFCYSLCNWKRLLLPDYTR